MSIVIGNLYILEKDKNGISYYALVRDCSKNSLETFDWIQISKLETPFMVLGEYYSGKIYFVHILLENKVGWINIDSNQLKLFKG